MQLRAPQDEENQIQEVDAPVDQHAAARLLFVGKGTTKTGNRAEGAEGAVYVVNVAEFALGVHLGKLHHRLLEAVTNADVQNLSLLFRLLSHLAGQGVIDRDRLLAQHVLASAESVHRHGVVGVVGGQHKDRLHLGVGKRHLVVRNYVLHLVKVSFRRLCLLRDQVAGVLDANVLQCL